MFGPNIALFAPTRVIGGRRFNLRTRVTCPWAMKFSGIDLQVQGGFISGANLDFSHNILWSRRVRLVGPGRLAEGVHEFNATYELPPGVPPTHLGTAFSIVWQAEVTARRRFWFDAQRQFTLNVEPDPQHLQAPPKSQGVWSSRPAGPLPRQPHAEISLGTTTLVPGGVLQGALALANTQYNQYRQLEIRLVMIESGYGSVPHIVKRWHLGLDRPGENAPIPFYFRLPDAMRPSFQFRHVAVHWRLEFTVDVAWKSDPTLSIPVQILPREFTASEAIREAPLAVGTDRIAVVWRHAADKTGFRWDSGRLLREYEGIQAELRIEDRQRRGQVVVGELRYDDLCVGLAWSDQAGLTTDSPGLAELIGDELPVLLAEAAPTVVDDRIVLLEWRDVGRSVEPLVKACQQLHAVAVALQRLLRELPPPTEVEESELARWRGEARRLGGRFQASAMRIVGQREVCRFRLASRRTRRNETADGLFQLPVARKRIGLEVVVQPSSSSTPSVREDFELDQFEEALAALERGLDEASPALSHYR